MLKRAMIALLLLSPHAQAALFSIFVSPTNLPWPGGIVPYQFETNVTPAQQSVYLDGLREWELAGNVRFVPRTAETSYLLLQFDYQNGDNSLILTSAMSQVMHIDSLRRGQIVHESGHALGLQHEQVRPDRNTYITVNFSNIVSYAWPLFQINTNETPHGAYDFESIMHYDRDIFSTNYGVAKTYDVNPPYKAYEPKMGLYYALSPGDRAALAFLYGPTTNALTNVVTTTGDGGAGSLRAAMYFAHDHPGTTFSFNISTNDPGHSNGVWTIYLTGHLPVLSSPDGFTIDGSTQPGFSNHPVIAINGSRNIPEANSLLGFLIHGANCRVRNLCVQSFTDRSIILQYPEATNNTVSGCYIGTDALGWSTVSNTLDGITVWRGARNNIIGGTNLLSRNVISGNGNFGVLLLDSNTYGNVVMGNYIGIAANGGDALPNKFSGVALHAGAHDNVIGGASASAGNVLAGNDSYGVIFADPGTTGNVARGNVIFSNFTGVAILNQAADNAVISNIISGHVNLGVLIGGSNVTRNVVQDNLVTRNVTGVGIFDRAASNVVSNNVLSTNQFYGAVIQDARSASNLLAGNALELNDSGIGIFQGACDNRIEQNRATHNAFSGMVLADNGTSNNVIRENVFASNTYGMAIFNGPKNNFIGPGNRIVSNAYVGILLADTNTLGNSIRGNSIYSNGFLGIDFSGDGVTANDPADTDSGPNGLQNYPEITNASAWGPATRLSGTLTSTPNRAFALDFYRNTSPDPFGYGEGETFMGSMTNATSAGGDLSFVFGFNGSFTGSHFTATATDLTTGDTSEFSANRATGVSTNGPAEPQIGQVMATNGSAFLLTITNDVGWLYRIQASTNLMSAWNDITNYISESPSFQLAVTTNLPQQFLRVVSP